MAARRAGKDTLNAYEAEREERIRRNNAKLAELGIFQQKTLFEASFKVIKKVPQSQKPKREKGIATPSRTSSRLQGSAPEFHGLSDDFADGLQELPKLRCDAAKEWTEALKERRCDSQGRGSLYDSKVGITCHFCRQKKLCGEADCPRCSDRNADLQCIGKSECSKCGSANGRFCRACLLIRYGLKLQDVRDQMAAGTWHCPHCYEGDHPDEGWICNSSICMTRRGLKPTGIAIYDAQQRGFASVAHYLQASFSHIVPGIVFEDLKNKYRVQARLLKRRSAGAEDDMEEASKAPKCKAATAKSTKAEEGAAKHEAAEKKAGPTAEKLERKEAASADGPAPKPEAGKASAPRRSARLQQPEQGK